MIFKRQVIITHDTIPYKYNEFSFGKYKNWLNMRRNSINVSDFKVDGFPYLLQIEPTNYCNLVCPFCPSGRNELGRERRHMRLNEFKSIIDDMQDYLFLLVLWGWGEPFLNPELPEMIAYANEKGIKTVTSTNGQLLCDDSYCERILKSGLATLIVAIDSLDEHRYELFRKGGDLGRVLNGFESFVAMKNELNSKVSINMRMVVTKYNENEIEMMRSKARSLGADRFTVKTVNPNPGTAIGTDEEVIPVNLKYRRYKYIKGTSQRIRKRMAICTFPWNSCIILSNGDVVACCYDFDGQMISGNAYQQRLTAIWNGPVFRELRKKLYYDKDSFDRCRDCDINFRSSPTGWFVESVEFNASASRDLENIMTSFGNRILNSVR